METLSHKLFDLIGFISSNLIELINTSKNVNIEENLQKIKEDPLNGVSILNDEMITVVLKKNIENYLYEMDTFLEDVSKIKERYEFLRNIYLTNFPKENDLSDEEKEEVKKYLESLGLFNEENNSDNGYGISGLNVIDEKEYKDFEEQLNTDNE